MIAGANGPPYNRSSILIVVRLLLGLRGDVGYRGPDSLVSHSDLDISKAFEIQKTQCLPVPKKCCYKRLRDNIPISRFIYVPIIPELRMCDCITELFELLCVLNQASYSAAVDGRAVDVNIRDVGLAQSQSAVQTFSG
jgi:hypothetical protein